MSRTYHLICPDARVYLWVGQGWDVESERGITIYSGGKYTDRLLRFIEATRGKELRLCDSEFSSELDGDFEEFEGET